MVLPAPFGPSSARISPSRDVEADALQRLEARGVDLAQILDGDHCRHRVFPFPDRHGRDGPPHAGATPSSCGRDSANLVLHKLRAVCLFTGQGGGACGASGAGARRRGCPGPGFPGKERPWEPAKVGRGRGRCLPVADRCVARPSPRSSARCILRSRGLSEGEVATYIPELSRARPEWFGIAIATVDGRVYDAGDARSRSRSSRCRSPSSTATRSRVWPGLRARRVGVEPTGEAFNSIVLDKVQQPAVQPDGQFRGDRGRRADQGRRRGAAARTCCRARRSSPAGGSSSTARSTRSEDATGHWNRAIAYMMLNSGMIERIRRGARRLFPAVLGAW